MKMIIGVDPGLRGGITLISGLHANYCYEMPVDEDGISACALFDIVETYGDKELVAYVEHAQAMPKQGVVSVFNYGVGFGKMLAALEISGVKIVLVRPAVWKKALKLPKEKLAAVEMAERLHPIGVFRTERGRLLDGKAEAFLIAHYGMLKEAGKI